MGYWGLICHSIGIGSLYINIISIVVMQEKSVLAEVKCGIKSWNFLFIWKHDHAGKNYGSMFWVCEERQASLFSLPSCLMLACWTKCMSSSLLGGRIDLWVPSCLTSHFLVQIPLLWIKIWSSMLFPDEKWSVDEYCLVASQNHIPEDGTL